MAFEFDKAGRGVTCIKVLGVGGGGNNAVNRMVSLNSGSVQYLAVNTDRAVLNASDAPEKISIGEKATRGQGAGANPQVGRMSAEESIDEIKAALEGVDMLFVTAGMGGGTGTGAAPVIAKTAKDMGILTVGVVTKPFAFEGKRRMDQAESGICELSEVVDALVVIPNERLKMISETRITLQNAFEAADTVLSRGVLSIADLIDTNGFINLDFADVKTVMKDAGLAHMGVGEAKGKDKAELAAKAAISSPLLETSISGAKGIIINITASEDISLEDTDTAAKIISSEAHPDAVVIFGVAFDKSLEDAMRITVIATGFDSSEDNEKEKESTPAAEEKKAPVAEKKAEQLDSNDIDFLLDMLGNKNK